MFPLSSEAADQWRPNGDRLSYADAGWIGASGGVVMHAALNFFSVALPSLERLLVVFSPAQRFAFSLTANAAPLGRWLMLILCEAGFWALAAMLFLALVHATTDLVSRGSSVATHHRESWARSRSASVPASAPPAGWTPRASSASSTR